MATSTKTSSGSTSSKKHASPRPKTKKAAGARKPATEIYRAVNDELMAEIKAKGTIKNVIVDRGNKKSISTGFRQAVWSRPGKVRYYGGHASPRVASEGRGKSRQRTKVIGNNVSLTEPELKRGMRRAKEMKERTVKVVAMQDGSGYYAGRVAPEIEVVLTKVELQKAVDRDYKLFRKASDKHYKDSDKEYSRRLREKGVKVAKERK